MTAFHELARISAERTLNGVIEGLAIALFAGLLLRVIGRRNSGARFVVLLAALFSIAALPVMNVVRASNGSAYAARAVWAVTMPSLWAIYVILAWAVVASTGLVRVALGLWQLRKLRTGSEAIDPASLDPVLQRTFGEFKSSRKVQLAVSEKLTVPAAIGFFHPMIVLPEWTLHELSPAELRSILIHEMAHLERRDDWTNLAQKVLRALLFFHPAVWWVERQLSLEREMACDDVVLARTSNPRAYAECLVTVAERSFMRRGLALAQAAVSRMRQTTLRVSQILDGNRAATTPVWKPALALVTMALGIFVVELARAPELVAFHESGPMVSLASVGTPAAMPKDPPAPLAAKAVLASFHETPIRKSRSAAAKVVPARLMLPPVADSALTVKAAAATQDTAPTQTVLVVMRTEQFGPSGEALTVQVWSFTMLKFEQIPAGLKNPAKSL
jgi:bla regulator protein blaR1